jgi:hypothetical protein
MSCVTASGGGCSGASGDDGPFSGIDSGADTGDDSGSDEVCVLDDPEQPASTNTIDMQSVMTVAFRSIYPV